MQTAKWPFHLQRTDCACPWSLLWRHLWPSLPRQQAETEWLKNTQAAKPFSVYCWLNSDRYRQKKKKKKESLQLHSDGADNVQQWQKLVMLPMWHPQTGRWTQIRQAVYCVLPQAILSPLSPMRPLWQSSSVPPQMKETGTEEDKATAGYIGHYIRQGECVDWQPPAFKNSFRPK